MIPSKNRHSTIRECVTACLNLDYPASRCEILVVDDGSEPPLPLFQDPRVQLIRQPGLGPAAARTRGLRAASGQFIAFTDDDCRPRPDWLSRLVGILIDEPETLIGGHTRNALSGNLYAATSQLLIDRLYVGFERRPQERFFTSNNLAGAREKFVALGGFDAEFPLAAAEDRDLCDRWRVSGGALHYAPSAVVDHYHKMSFTDFLRQQHNYGRGARLLSARRAARHGKFAFQPLNFYFELFSELFRSYPAFSAIYMSGLLVFAHIANLAGFIAEGARSKPAVCPGSSARDESDR